MAATNNLWKMSPDQLERLTFVDLFEAMHLDKMVNDLDDIAEGMQPGDVLTPAAHKKIERTCNKLSGLYGLLVDAHRRIEERAIEKSKYLLTCMAADRLGTRDFKKSTFHAEILLPSHNVDVMGSFETVDGRSTSVIITQLEKEPL